VISKDTDDTDPSRVKTLCDSPDHISAKLNQRILSADHGIHTSNIASSVASDDSNSSNNTESASLRTASHRPKTVKTLGSKMRSTGKHGTSRQQFTHGVTFCSDSLLTFLFVLLAVISIGADFRKSQWVHAPPSPRPPSPPFSSPSFHSPHLPSPSFSFSFRFPPSFPLPAVRSRPFK